MKIREKKKLEMRFSSFSVILVVLTMFLNFTNSFFYLFYFSMLLISLAIIAVLYFYKKVKFTLTEKPDSLQFTLLGFLVAIVSIPLITNLTTFNIFLQVSMAGVIESVFIIAIYQIIPLKRYASVLIASGVFAYLHLQVFEYNLILVFSAFVFSVICIIFSIKARSYLPAILIHLVWNIFAGFNQV